MSVNPGDPMNGMIRRAGSRARSLPGSLPNIGQTPAVQAANQVMSQAQTPGMQQTPPATGMGAAMTPPAPAAPTPSASPMAAPAVQPNTLTLHPPGTPADPNQYNYEPQPDGAWRVYPPGVPAPSHTVSASLPRAASTADYRRMREAFTQVPGQQPQ